MDAIPPTRENQAAQSAMSDARAWLIASRGTLAQILVIAVSVPILVLVAWIGARYSIGNFWLTLVALVPGFLIFQHGVYLLTSKPRIVTTDGNEEVSQRASDVPVATTTLQSQPAGDEEVREQASVVESRAAE